ncbi:uncharacterized protein LOC144424278 [Styela clava]
MKLSTMNQEFRIRELQREDLFKVRKIIRNGLYKKFYTLLKILCWKNRNVLGIITLLTVMFTAIFDGNIIISLVIQMLILFVAISMQFIMEIQLQINDVNDFDKIQKRYVRFWVMEHIQNYETFIVGTVALRTLHENVSNTQSIAIVELKRMSVSSNFRKRGIGRKLLAHAVNEASELSYNRIILDCTELQMPAISMYQTYGFITTRIIKLPLLFVLPGIDMHYMERKL